jgi:hypothetical protein
MLAEVDVAVWNRQLVTLAGRRHRRRSHQHFAQEWVAEFAVRLN